MEKLLKFVTYVSISIINFFLAFYAIGFILNHWELRDLLGPYYNMNNYLGVIFIFTIFRVGSISKISMLQQKIKLKEEDKMSDIKHSIIVTASIFITVLMSYLYSLIFSLF